MKKRNPAVKTVSFDFPLVKGIILLVFFTLAIWLVVSGKIDLRQIFANEFDEILSQADDPSLNGARLISYVLYIGFVHLSDILATIAVAVLLLVIGIEISRHVVVISNDNYSDTNDTDDSNTDDSNDN